jgi:hypothetical protein
MTVVIVPLFGVSADKFTHPVHVPHEPINKSVISAAFKTGLENGVGGWFLSSCLKWDCVLS